jgi:IS30 family transposase
MSTPVAMAERCVKVQRLASDGASIQQIAAQLSISVDTVRRDLKKDGAMKQWLTQRAAQTAATVQQAVVAAQAVADVQPAFTLADDETARQWWADLRAAAEKLSAAADAFSHYYPGATGS